MSLAEQVTSICPASLAEHELPDSIVDVRTPPEFRAVHAQGAINLPLDGFDAKRVVAMIGAERPIYVICRSGQRSARACELLRAAGASRVINVEGGTNAWQRAGLPVIRGSRGIPLDGQVRIAAGTMALVAAGLAFMGSPVAPWLAVMLGVGLIHAGATGSCAMGMLLSFMPWNR